MGMFSEAGVTIWATNRFLNLSGAPRNDAAWFNQVLISNIEKKFKDAKGGVVIVGITGHAGSGKDSSTDYLTTILPDNSKVLHFADKLKAIGRLFFTDEQLKDRRLKETTDEFWGISPRKFLQMCGTEMFRNVWREDIWTKCLEREIMYMQGNADENAKGCIVFVPDVRFHNEADTIHKLGGIVVRVVRQDNPLSIDARHDSERFIDELPVDLTVENKADNSEEWSLEFAKSLVQYWNGSAFYF